MTKRDIRALERLGEKYHRLAYALESDIPRTRLYAGETWASETRELAKRAGNMGRTLLDLAQTHRRAGR